MAIAVIIIVGIGAYPLYKNAHTNSQVEQATNNVITLQKNVRILFTGQSNYTALGAPANSIALLNNAGMLPEGMSVDPSTGYGTDQLGIQYYIRADNAGFDIETSFLPKEVCIPFIQRLAPMFEVAGNTLIKSDDTGLNKVDINQLTTTCNTIAGNRAPAIFTSYR